jgi:hypothetical protein
MTWWGSDHEVGQRLRDAAAIAWWDKDCVVGLLYNL